MPLLDQLKYIYLAYSSKPAADRRIYRAIRRQQIHRIVELGVGSAQRAKRMIAVAQQSCPGRAVQYTGVDGFELRGDEDGLPLKEAFRQLRATGAKVRLLPGDPLMALAGKANDLVGTQLLIVSADQDPQALEQAWFYVPRMLTPKALVLVEHTDERGETKLQLLPHSQIQQMSNRPAMRRAA